jgi:streptomycin 6-kinase
MFEPYLSRWELVPDGEAIVTHSSRLLPVLYRGEKAMLKIAVEAEEKRGGLLMLWWDGDGAARVLEHEDDALLLERATGTRSLEAMARDGRDDEASRIICAVAARLHALRGALPSDLVPLEEWFRGLWPAAETHGGILRRGAETARELLDTPQEVGVLHGDLHHGNVLDFGPGGWLAIDPKRLVGQRGFDFVDVLRNPDADVALAPGRLARQASIVAEAAQLERTRLLQWTLAFTGLSAAWIIGDGDDPALDLGVAALAAAELSLLSNSRRARP